MSENSKRQWIVLDSVTKIQSQPLTDQQLQMSVLRMHEKDWDRFFIWTDTWENWQPLRAFLKSDQQNFLNVLNITNDKNRENTITKSRTTVHPNHREITNTSFQIDDSSADMENIDVNKIAPPSNISFKKLRGKSDFKSRAVRHDLKIEILLATKTGKTFRSYSKNISLTGTLLEDHIPFDYHGEIFDVIVVNRYAKSTFSTRVQAKGQVVGEGVSRRIQFEKLNDQTQEKLLNLLNEYLENQKNMTKKAS